MKVSHKLNEGSRMMGGLWGLWRSRGLSITSKVGMMGDVVKISDIEQRLMGSQ